jgi:predicted dehydrogenase
MQMKKVNWGILSTAKIGREKVIPAMQKGQFCHISAVASRSLEHAREYANAMGIDKAYGSYEELLADSEVDAIYNPLPNDQHVAWTLAAARAGKHVLCEKPFAMNARQAEELREVASQVHIMEAFMVRFHPQWLRARELVRNGVLGDLRTVQVFFSYFNRQPANIRNRPELGGGAIYDIGCYAIVVGRFLFESEPLRAVALIERDPDFHTDRNVTAILDFGGGRRLDFTVSTQSVPYQRVQAIGTKQRLELEIPFNAPLGGATRLLLDDASSPGGASALAESIAPCDMYTLQGDVFSQAVRGQLPLPYGLDDAICNLRVIDALFKSGQSGQWEEV